MKCGNGTETNKWNFSNLFCCCSWRKVSHICCGNTFKSIWHAMKTNNFEYFLWNQIKSLQIFIWICLIHVGIHIINQWLLNRLKYNFSFSFFILSMWRVLRHYFSFIWCKRTFLQFTHFFPLHVFWLEL